jgi:hypothetical protein
VLWVVVICALATHVILEHTRLGRYAFAIGSNPDAAVYAGVPVAFDTTVIYALGGLLTGLAGMIEASRLMTGQPTAGNGYELQAIAAVVIGGGSLHGGEGSVVGTLIGALIMGLLSNGSDLLGISPYLQQAIIGAVIILAVTVDELRKRRCLFRQILQIRQVLRPPAGRLVLPQTSQTDHGNHDFLNPDQLFFAVTRFELDSGDRGEDLNPDGWHSHANHVIPVKKQAGGQPRRGEPELAKGALNSGGVFRINVDPHVEIVGGPDMTVDADRVSANQQVFNAVRVERLQELFEVPR